jgi:hypothetical protein
MHYGLALPCIAAFSMQGSANFDSTKGFVAFGFLRRNSGACVLNENGFFAMEFR